MSRGVSQHLRQIHQQQQNATQKQKQQQGWAQQHAWHAWGQQGNGRQIESTCHCWQQRKIIYSIQLLGRVFATLERKKEGKTCPNAVVDGQFLGKIWRETSYSPPFQDTATSHPRTTLPPHNTASFSLHKIKFWQDAMMYHICFKFLSVSLSALFFLKSSRMSRIVGTPAVQFPW